MGRDGAGSDEGHDGRMEETREGEFIQNEGKTKQRCQGGMRSMSKLSGPIVCFFHPKLILSLILEPWYLIFPWNYKASFSADKNHSNGSASI